MNNIFTLYWLRGVRVNVSYQLVDVNESCSHDSADDSARVSASLSNSRYIVISIKISIV